MLSRDSLVGRLLASRRAAIATTVAIAMPALLTAAGAATEVGLIGVTDSRLQAAADAGAAAGRQALDPFTPGAQAQPVTDAQLKANGNFASSLAAADVEQGWWDIKAKAFGPSIPGQTGAPFNNAVRVTTRNSHALVFGSLLGVYTVNRARQSIAYKCSNTDYPQTVIPDDANPPAAPAIWSAFAADSYGPTQSYYYQNPNAQQNPTGRKNPVFKFWSPTDGQDVSFVMVFDNGYKLQVDTYCRGTFLVVPDAFDFSGFTQDLGATIYAGATNNSFAVVPDPWNYPLAFTRTTYTVQNPQTISYLSTNTIHTTPYPNVNGCCQYWASDGDPTPDRRSILTQ